MNIKIFFVLILTVLTIIGYQKYADYSAIKSINSYDSCVTAKGSLIQESYPATCVTSLNARFIQPIPSINPAPGVIYDPILTLPVRNSIINSPTLVVGFAPPGWFFEGVMPINLVDDHGRVILETQATENSPGSWLTGNPVGFSATLTFSTLAKSGKLILSKDNPSGLPENEMLYEFPVKFAN